MNVLKRWVGRSSKLELTSEDPTRNRGCSEFEADAWQLSAFVLERLVPVVGVQPFPLHELMLLTSAVCRLRPRCIFEWGTHIGKSARVFNEVTRHYGIEADIHSIDLPDDVAHVEHPSRARGFLVRGLDRVHLYQGDGVNVALALWKRFRTTEQALFFVDGDHAEESVYRELSAIVAEVGSAAILLHDTFFQSPMSGYNIGPHRAIERVLQRHPRRFNRVDSGLGLPGVTLLYPATA